MVSQKTQHDLRCFKDSEFCISIRTFFSIIKFGNANKLEEVSHYRCQMFFSQ